MRAAVIGLVGLALACGRPQGQAQAQGQGQAQGQAQAQGQVQAQGQAQGQQAQGQGQAQGQQQPHLQPATATTATEDNGGLGPKADRRKLQLAVIGGCGKICSTPDSAVSFLLVQLQSQHRVRDLRPLFEWSLLQYNGQNLGDRWQGLWDDPARHAVRDAEIDAFLQRWSAWVDRISEPNGLQRMSAAGIQMKMDLAKPDVAHFTLKHPPLGNDATDKVWRWTLQQRGDEWLVSAIDERPAGQR